MMAREVRYFFPRNRDLTARQDYDRTIRPLVNLPYPIFAGEVHEDGQLIGWRLYDFETLYRYHEELTAAHKRLKVKNSDKAREIVAMRAQIEEKDSQIVALQAELATLKKRIPPPARRPKFSASAHAAGRLRERFGLTHLRIPELQQLLVKSLAQAGRLIYEALSKVQLWAVELAYNSKTRTVWCFVAPGPAVAEVKTVYTSELLFGGRIHGPERRAL